MRFIADLHIHSHFSRATSKDLVPEELSFWAQKKGISVIGTGDFTHPGWLAELQEKLVEAENGLYRLRPDLEKGVAARVPESCRAETRYVLSGEISCIYKRGGRTRKVHNLIIMPDFDTVRRLNEKLGRIGNLRSDGRPILGLDSHDLLDIALETSEQAFFIPAHIWTPWFSLFGSKSGFDEIEECFGDLTSHIHALETGLSSDPAMNRRLSVLDRYLLVSNSDAHSSAKLGREANIFDVALGYDQILEAMISQKGFAGTVEFFPEEGKYHLDGHRKCRTKLHPGETQKHKGLCPTCGKPITVGVLHRVYELSDRDSPSLSLPFHSLIPLPEILSEILGCGPSTKKVSDAYEGLLAAIGPEIGILMETPLEEIGRAGGPLLEEAIQRMRLNRVIREEGYDGEYGVIRLFDESERRTFYGQTNLFKPPEKRSRESGAQPFFPEKPKKEEENKEPLQPPLFDPILSPLNDEQKEAVLFQGNHLLIVAGPGTGKTLTLTHRIAYQIRSGFIRPEEILALTFTNKAAQEMKKRLTALTPGSRIHVATFHAFCLEVLREKGSALGLPLDFGLLSETDAGELVRQVLTEWVPPGRVRDSIRSEDPRPEVAGRVEGSRIRIPSVARFLGELPQLKLASVEEGKKSDPLFDLCEKYQLKLRTLGMLDLLDLEVETLRLFKNHPEVAAEFGKRFPKIFVDEYQDTNRIQVELLKSLASPELNPLWVVDRVEDPVADHPELIRREQSRRGPRPVSVCAIGDPDQAIYGFRGANVENFHRFVIDFPGAKTVTLLVNYRSTQPILDAASSLMKKKQKLKGVLGIGEPVRISGCRTEAEEAEMIVEQIEKLIGGTSYFSLDSGRASSHDEHENLGFGDIAVLFRLNAQGNAFEEAFSRAGIPFVRSGEKPLIEGFPVNVLWRFLQTLLYPENPYYRESYHQILKNNHLSSAGFSSSPLGGEVYSPDSRRMNPHPVAPKESRDRGEGETGDELTLLELISQAVALHGLAPLSEEEENRLRRLKDLAKEGHANLRSFLDVVSLDRGIDHAGLLGDRVAVMSLHAAKGLEWPVVFIAGCEDRLLPFTLYGDQNEAEERRLFYVGMTRARSRLVLSHAARRALNSRPLDMKPSPFTLLIPQSLLRPLERKPWKPKKNHSNQLALF